MPYLRDEKAKIQTFISVFPLALRDETDFDEPKSLEESIRKTKHYYDYSKCKLELKCDWKGNEKNKGKGPRSEEYLRI